MVAELKRIGRMYALYARMDLMWLCQDTLCCVVVMLSEAVAALSSVSGVLLLAARFQGVGGLRFEEILFMLGFFTLAEGVTNILFGGGNVLHISRRVGRGQVDHMLIQPAPLWMQLLTEGFIPVSGSAGLLVGLGLAGYATWRLDISVNPAWLGALALYLLTRTATTLGLSFLTASGAFYRPVAWEEISTVAVDLLGTLGRYPLAGLPRGLAATLMTAPPAGMMAYLPAMALLGRAQGFTRLLPVLAAALYCALAAYFFRKGLKHYAQYSCNRYRDMGHR